MASDPARRLRYADLQVTPDNGKRYELVRGALLVTPSPSPMHQRVSKRLMLALIEYFEGRSIGEVFHAPTDVILTDEDVFVPDLLVVRKPEDVSSRGIEGPPVLVVEILSPPTCTQDCGVKAERYAQLGVEHYWIVDPDARRVECRRLEGKRFARRVEGEGDAVLEHPDSDGFVLDVGALWR